MKHKSVNNQEEALAHVQKLATNIKAVLGHTVAVNHDTDAKALTTFRLSGEDETGAAPVVGTYHGGILQLRDWFAAMEFPNQ